VSEGGFNPFGSWDDFSATMNTQGHAFKSLIGQDKLGQWSPTISFNSATTGITYSVQVGLFVKIGKLIIASYVIALSSKGSAVGGAAIEGLPLVVGNSPGGASHQIGSAIGFWSAMTTSYVFLGGYTIPSTRTFTLRGATAAATGLGLVANTDFSDTTSLSGHLIYFTDR
jgi:hypothetical protein